MKASWREHETLVGFQKVHLMPGQFIFGRKMASVETGLSERTIRTSLLHLQNYQNLTIKATNKFSIITIINWEIYQSSEDSNDQQSDQHPTSKRPASDHKQEVIERKEGNKEYLRRNTKILSASGDAVGGSGTEFYLTKRKRKLTGKRLKTFNQFWSAFAYPKGKAEAADAWLDIPSLTDSIVETIITKAKAEAEARKEVVASGKTPKWAQGWITGRRWEDEQAEVEMSWEERMEAKSAASRTESVH